MRLNITDPTVQLNIGLTIEDNISDGLIRIKMNFSIGGKSKFTILNPNLFDSFQSNFLGNFFGTEILRQIKNISCFLVNFVLWNYSDSTFITKMHWNRLEIRKVCLYLFKRKWVLWCRLVEPLLYVVMG